MAILRVFTSLVLLVVATHFSGLLPTAHSASAVLMARANVLPWATLRTERHVESYVVDDEDIARGYVVIRSAATFQLTTNSNRQVVVRPVATDGMAVRIAGPNGQCSPCLRVALDPGPAVGRMTRTIDYRIDLSGDVVAGRYPLDTALEIETY